MEGCAAGKRQTPGQKNEIEGIVKKPFNGRREPESAREMLRSMGSPEQPLICAENYRL
jgi:hypothetical protein